jgi:tetratricopeptide (TPR) repeat protein
MIQPDPGSPRSLQAMILEAQAAMSQPKRAKEADDECESILTSADAWFERLARGEYEQILYWRCAAEDCEEAGDWAGAIQAHRQILTSPDASDVDRSQAHSEIAMVQRVLGDDENARESYHLASTLARPLTDVLCRHYSCNEATQLCRMGCADEARQLIDEALAAHQEALSVDHLGMGRMLIVLAKCEMAKAELQSARESLELAWEWLESLRQAYESEECLKDAVGVGSALAVWWQVSAELYQLNDDNDAAIMALCKARDLATRCAEHSGWSRYDFDFYQMNVLIKLVAAYAKGDRFEKASEVMKKAIEIRVRRKFPTRS